MTGEREAEIPDTGAVFTFGKSKIANNAPSRLWLKSDIPVHISCGRSHSAFVTEQGHLFVFGDNNRGQLGLQTKGPVTKPVCVKVFKGERAQSVACGTDHTLVSTSQGEILATGGNSDGQLGLGHCNDSISFQRLRSFCDYAPIKLLSAGDRTSAALTEDGRLFLWGDNSAGQLGFGNDSHALLPKELKLGQSIHWVSCGYRHSALVTDSGDVFTFGESADGRLGLSSHQLANHSHPQRVESLHSVLQVACGGKHTLALTEDELYCFGAGQFGQLGLGTFVFVADSPVAVGHFRKGRVTQVTCGEHQSALITDSGLLYTFGDGRHGKLGHGDENFTNQFSPTVCQRFFEYSVMTVACGSSHMLVLARPRQQESEEVCLEDEDVTYSYLDRCYTSMLQGQPLEHIPDPETALVSQSTFLSSPLPTSHRRSLSTRARRRQRESSSAQFGPEFSNLPPLTTSYTALALTGTILQPRSSKDTPKRINTDAPVDSPSTFITLPAKEPSFTPITKSPEDCHCVETSENSLSDKTSAGREEDVPQQALPTELQADSVLHPSITESSSSRNLLHKKPRCGDAEVEAHSSVTALQSKVQSKTNKKTIQSTNNKSVGQEVEVKLSPDRMSAKEKEGLSETCSTNIDVKDAFSKADKYSKDSRGEEVITLSDTEQETKSSSIKIQQTSSSIQEVEKVRTTPTSTQEVKSPKTKKAGIPAKASKRVKSPIKVQEMPTGEMKVSKVKPTPQIGAQSNIEPSIEKVGLALIDTQEQGNLTPVKIAAEMQSTPKIGNEKMDVDTKESPSDYTAKKAEKKRTTVERGPIAEPTAITPSPLSVSIPTQMSKAKHDKTLETENSSPQLTSAMLAQETTEVKRENNSKTPQSSEIISFPPIKSKKSAAEKSQSASTLQSDHKNSQSPTDKALAEQKHEFPSIKSLAPERSHSDSNLWSNNQSATNKSSAPKAAESGKLFSSTSSSPQLRQSPLNKRNLRTFEPKEPVLVTETPHQQSEQNLMGSVVSVPSAMAIASAAPLLIKAAEVLSETSPEQGNEVFSCASVSQETAGNKILQEQEVEQDDTVQDISTIEQTNDSRNKQQIPEDLQNELVSDEVWKGGNEKMDEEKDVKGGETEREEKESVAEEDDKSKGCGKEEEKLTFEDEPEGESENAQKGGEDSEEEEGEEEESDAVGEEEDGDDGGKSSEIEGEKSDEGGSRDTAESEEGEESEGQEEGETEDKDAEDEEEGKKSGDEDSERQIEDEEKTDAEEGESSNEEETEGRGRSDSEDVSKNDRSDEEEEESEENGSEREEEEDVEEGEQEESEVENEDEEENQEEEENQAKEEEEEEENNEEPKEENNSNNEEGEESVREKEEQEVEDENEENMSDKGNERKEGGEQIEEQSEIEGKMESSEVAFREDEKVDVSETQETDDEDINEKNKEDKSGSEEEEDDDETDKQEERRGRKGRETKEEEGGEEEDEEAEQKETSEEEEQAEESEEEEEETEQNSGKTRETSEEEEEEQEENEEEEEEEEEEAEWKEKRKTEKGKKQRESSEEEEGDEEEEEEHFKKDKHGSKLRENKDEEEEEEEEEGEEEEKEGEEEQDDPKKENKNIKTGKDWRKHRTISEEEEEEEGNEEEEETKQEKKNIKAEKNRRKQTETSEEEEEEEGEEEEEEEESEEEEGEEEDESEEEKEKTKKITKQKAKPNVLPAHRQTNGQTEIQKTRQSGKQNVKMRKQTDGAQDPQFWNNVLPQYLNLK